MGGGKTTTLGKLAEALRLEFTGDAALPIEGLAPLESAEAGQLSFLANPKYRAQLRQTRAAAVILKPEFAADCPVACLLSPDPYLSFARSSALFADEPRPAPGIHPSAVVADSARLAAGVAVAANAVVGERADIGADSVIGPGTVVGDDVRIGSGCLLHANVTLYHGVRIGDHVTIHSAVVIGGDGFGFAPSGEGWVKIHQLGSVRIGDRVEIGAGTTIDRGALQDTVIGDGVIIDDQVMIAHNCVIGDGTAIAGRAAMAGSAVVGKNCILAGDAGLVGHISIADNVQITARTMVTHSIREAGSYSSGVGGAAKTAEWRRNAVRFSQLDAMYRRISDLEKQVAALSKGKIEK